MVEYIPDLLSSGHYIVTLYVLITVGTLVLDFVEFASVFVGVKGFQYRNSENISTVWPGKILPVICISL